MCCIKILLCSFIKCEVRSTARVIASKYFLILITGTRINTSGPHTTPHHSTPAAGMLQLDTCRGCSLRLDAAARHVLRCSLRCMMQLDTCLGCNLRLDDATEHVLRCSFEVGCYRRVLRCSLRLDAAVGEMLRCRFEVGDMLRCSLRLDWCCKWTRVEMQLEVECCS